MGGECCRNREEQDLCGSGVDQVTAASRTRRHSHAGRTRRAGGQAPSRCRYASGVPPDGSTGACIGRWAVESAPNRSVDAITTNTAGPSVSLCVASRVTSNEVMPRHSRQNGTPNSTLARRVHAPRPAAGPLGVSTLRSPAAAARRIAARACLGVQWKNSRFLRTRRSLIAAWTIFGRPVALVPVGPGAVPRVQGCPGGVPRGQLERQLFGNEHGPSCHRLRDVPCPAFEAKPVSSAETMIRQRVRQTGSCPRLTCSGTSARHRLRAPPR